MPRIRENRKSQARDTKEEEEVQNGEDRLSTLCVKEKHSTSAPPPPVLWLLWPVRQWATHRVSPSAHWYGIMVYKQTGKLEVLFLARAVHKLGTYNKQQTTKQTDTQTD